VVERTLLDWAGSARLIFAVGIAAFVTVTVTTLGAATLAQFAVFVNVIFVVEVVVSTEFALRLGALRTDELLDVFRGAAQVD